MFVKNGTKESVERQLDDILILEAKTKEEYTRLTEEIEEKTHKYNAGVKVLNLLRKDYKEKETLLNDVISDIQEYKSKKKSMLKATYIKEIHSLITKINTLNFSDKAIIFQELQKFDSIDFKEFINLKTAGTVFVKKKVGSIIKEMCDSISMENIIAAIQTLSLVIRLEKHLATEYFLDWMYNKFEFKFKYHFFSLKDSARFDKPEWMFKFILDELDKNAGIIEIYDDLYENERGMQILLKRIMLLVERKASQISCSESTQKRNLLLHFAKEMHKFTRIVKQKYKIDIQSDIVRNKVTKQEIIHIHEKLELIHELSYLQWFDQYKRLIKEVLGFIVEFLFLGHGIDVNDVINLICFHTQEFCLNMNYLNREEVRVICYIFSEIENLKEFIIIEEMDIKIHSAPLENYNILGTSLDKLTSVNFEISKLIQDLARIDANTCIKILGTWTYTTPEEKRTFILQTYEYMNDYILYKAKSTIEKIFNDAIDAFLLEKVVLVFKFDSNDFLDFVSYYETIKRDISNLKLQHSEKGINMLKHIFNGNTQCKFQSKEDTQLFQKISALYYN